MSKLNKTNQAHALYLCYFGVREPLVQTQVLPYLRQIVAGGVKVSLLTFEPMIKETWTKEQKAEQTAKLAAENISWHCLPYHKRFSVPATFYDVLAGVRFAAGMVKKEQVNVLHARFYVPALIGLLVKKISGRNKPAVIFDIRGFMPEEYVDGGMWKKDGSIYHTVKRIEKWLLAESDAFVVLTEKAREILFPESRLSGFDAKNRPVEVIPCCVDLARFSAINVDSRNEIRKKFNLEERNVFVYIGSFGTWYLVDEMSDLLAEARKRDKKTFAMILTQSDPQIIISRLLERGFSEQDFLVTKVSPPEIPKYLSAADVAISFIKACYSKLSSSPTKIAEYLASGLPIICNSGIGDVDEVIKDDKVGVVIDNYTPESYIKALAEIEELRRNADLAERCKQSARERFDLDKVGGEKYRQLYRKLLSRARN